MSVIERSRAAPEQSRARYPEETGYIERNGVKVFWERYGAGEPTAMFMPAWSVVHSRVWKAQIPYFARHCRVVAFDGRGNGGSDRPLDPAAYNETEFAADALDVLDATGTERAVLVALSRGAERSLLLAAEHPERVAGIVFISPALPLAPVAARATAEQEFVTRRAEYEGWQKWNSHYWREHYEDFLEFFFSHAFSEPHSTKQREDAVAWGLETDAETLIATQLGGRWQDEASVREVVKRIQCPVLVLHGRDDAVRPHDSGAALAQLAGGEFVSLEASGHCPQARDPVKVNLLLRDFILPRRERTSAWTRARARPRRALYVSSPIGLGHARRDVAIASELRALVPDLEIDWLAQDPVTKVLAAEGERIHPASAHLASESGHIESESAEHDLHCFQAWRRMDEILVANFMVFHDLVESEQYDLWIGDEAWDVDYFLHENPELKRAAYCWLTDFVGWLPMSDGGEREAFLTSDYNGEMIEQIARFPRLRDRAIFVGNPDDVVPDAFGPDLPEIRAWTEDHYAFAGYVSGFDPVEFSDRAALRADLGYSEDERVCIVSVGGSGVGEHLLRRVIEAHPVAAAQVPGLRTIVVAGPRIAPETLPHQDGLEVVGYVHNLYRHLAACDLAVVQGGLTTAMELTPPIGARSCTSRSSTISSRASTYATASIATVLGVAWTSTSPHQRSSRMRSSPRSVAGSTTGQSRQTAHARPRSNWRSCCSKAFTGQSRSLRARRTGLLDRGQRKAIPTRRIDGHNDITQPAQTRRDRRFGGAPARHCDRRPGRRLRRGPEALQRDDRQAAAVDRALRRRGRCHRRRRLRPGERARDRDPVRCSQRRRSRQRR
jgi:pimeloyl-ACP methyl ester carboxylesterase